MMKKYSFLLAVLLSVLFTSCLKDGLDEGELSTECNVINVKFEHRWAVEMGTPGMYMLNFKEMSVVKTFNEEQGVINVTITVPQTDGNYPAEQRIATVLSNLACSLEVSRAANVNPLGGAPVLGTLGDYSLERIYRVTSASGKYKDWTVIVSEFIK